MAEKPHLPHGTRTLFRRRVDPPVPMNTLYGDRRPGTYPQSAGIPAPFVARWNERFNPELDPDPHIYVAADVWETHFTPGTRFSGYLVDAALVHPALLPCFSPRLPFLRPANFLSGAFGAGVLDLLGQASAAREALNVLLSSDAVTARYVKKFRNDLPPYLFEGQLKCDSCIELGKTYNCPCIFVNLGRMTDPRTHPGVTGYALKCFSCAELKRRCIFSLRCVFSYGEVVLRGVELHARVVSHTDTPDLKLGDMVWWPGQRPGIEVYGLGGEGGAEAVDAAECDEAPAEEKSEEGPHNGSHAGTTG
ncbi:uncharacterized protein LOC62_03G005084 [Vanrija pseudolonga]|uniref:Uncharacterized protein n=1 Tax=Vanrija pseudolonga TaxID=143232 RepID=A0AAF0Y7Y6_9TREE|nr:hypothetical protein LOC62_03G005084 [Vanrija pseudolonga]